MRANTVFILIMMIVTIGVTAAKKNFNDDDEKQIYPNGCYPEGFEFKYSTLLLHPHSKGRNDSIYFIHNKSNHQITLNQMRSDKNTFVLNLDNTIYTNQWGAYASDENIVKFICTLPDKNSSRGKIVDCEEVLEICEYSNSLLGANQKGNYWMVPSASKGNAKHRVKRQGALLRY